MTDFSSNRSGLSHKKLVVILRKAWDGAADGDVSLPS